MRVSLFITCYNDTLFPESLKAVVQVLRRLGHTVEVPAGQTCCGQMHINSGYHDDAVPLLPRFVEQFRAAEAVVAPSSSCVATMREQYPAMARDIERTGNYPALVRELDALLARTWEFSEFLTKKLGLTDVGACYPHKVTYHASCHGLRTLHLGDGPETLLRNVRGLELIQLDNVDTCCGFGGTFAIKNPDVSAAMLADKTACIRATGASICTATDNSCLMHIAGGLHRHNAPTQTLHLAQILAGESDSSESQEAAK